MAVNPCAECGGTVSDRAAACPHCGAPVDGAKSEAQPFLTDPMRAPSPPKSNDYANGWRFYPALLAWTSTCERMLSEHRYVQPPPLPQESDYRKPLDYYNTVLRYKRLFS